jgi:hypothetical protein
MPPTERFTRGVKSAQETRTGVGFTGQWGGRLHGTRRFWLYRNFKAAPIHLRPEGGYPHQPKGGPEGDPRRGEVLEPPLFLQTAGIMFLAREPNQEDVLSGGDPTKEVFFKKPFPLSLIKGRVLRVVVLV